jgi:DNA helicase II / ATP-dependent DNA helicase PcrA
MKYIADLHIHSKYSRATAKNLDLEHLYIAAQLKGITVLATGDYTHPAWFAEISEKLEPAESGLFKLKEDLAKACDREVPGACRRDVRFILSTEISSIYKKNDFTRKNHNLVFMPDLDSAARFNARLDAIGNIKADGRPILGLDARNLLEIALETSDDAFLIPAHIWTPWFSLFGSKSGFDSINECFEDLTPHIFALETGLSSDPLMNWRVSDIDGMTLVSNSDAHSPANLGREANLFDTELSYAGLRNALKNGDPGQFLGTYEFFPEEGKYHFDGHRNCGICLHPEESMAHKGLCPVCGSPLTLGVLHRVEALADRPEGEKPDRHHPYYSLIPLAEMLSEILGVGPKSKKVGRAYKDVLENLGSEFEVLYTLEPDAIKKDGPPLLDMAISRMRSGDIDLAPGYDGEYGRVKVFKEGEKEKLRGEQALFAMPADKKTTSSKTPEKKAPPPPPSAAAKTAATETAGTDMAPAPEAATPQQMDLFGPPEEDEATAGQRKEQQKKRVEAILSDLNKQQRIAVTHDHGPLMIVAGPGSGKTRTITCRMAWLIAEKKVAPEQIMAITFTNRAANEMARRLSEMLGKANILSRASTFHAFCLEVLKETGGEVPVIMDEDDRRMVMAEVLDQLNDPENSPESQPETKIDARPAQLLDRIAAAKQNVLFPDDDLSAVAGDIPADQLAVVYRAYQEILAANNACDYEDLIFKVVRLWEETPPLQEKYRQRFPFVFIDEYQDSNYCQYRLVRALAPPDGDICVIGDPDQAIYGFRGSSPIYFDRFKKDYPKARCITLERNYRSTETILAASYDVISKQGDNTQRVRVYSGIEGAPAVTMAQLNSGAAEGVFIGKTIEELIGGLGFHSVDFNRAGYGDGASNLAFSDIAVLVRTRAQAAALAETLLSAGIPCQTVNKDSLFARKGMAELMAFLRMGNGAGSFIDLKRIMGLTPSKNIGKTFQTLNAWCRERKLSVDDLLANISKFPIDGLSNNAQRDLADLAEKILTLRKAIKSVSMARKIDYILEQQEDLNALIRKETATEEALAHLLNLAKASGKNSRRFFDTVALLADADACLPKADRVMLMTMHAAKGLEFPVVFIAGCEDGFLPYQASVNRSVDVDEERRLFYVAMTRARQRLYLTYAKKRRIFGKTEKRVISPFAGDIEARLKEQAKSKTGKQKAKADNGPKQLELF